MICSGGERMVAKVVISIFQLQGTEAFSEKVLYVFCKQRNIMDFALISNNLYFYSFFSKTFLLQEGIPQSK